MEGTMEISSIQEPVRPWLTIWTKPQKTIRQIVDFDADYYVIPLAAAMGIFQALDRAAERGMGDNMSLVAILLLAVLVGGISGVISVYIAGALYRWSGSWFGGQATSQQVRAAVAWASIPDVLLLLIIIPIILIFGRDWFTSSPSYLNSAVGTLSVLALGAIGLVLVFWRLFIMVACLAEVHRFSARRALAALFTGTLVVIVPLVALIIGCAQLSR
jgi:hypothetical protein